MKILRSIFLVVMLLVAVLAVTDTAYSWPPCGHWVGNTFVLYNGPGETEYAWWVNALCETHEVTLAQFNYYCHTSYSGITPCTIAD